MIAKALMENFVVGMGIANFVLKQLYGHHHMNLDDLKEYDEALHKNV